MATREQEITEIKFMIGFVDDMMVLIVPMIAVFICAVASLFSDTPTKWLIRASVWLVVGIMRYLAGRR